MTLELNQTAAVQNFNEGNAAYKKGRLGTSADACHTGFDTPRWLGARVVDEGALFGALVAVDARTRGVCTDAVFGPGQLQRMVGGGALAQANG